MVHVEMHFPCQCVSIPCGSPTLFTQGPSVLGDDLSVTPASAWKVLRTLKLVISCDEEVIGVSSEYNNVNKARNDHVYCPKCAT